MIEILQVYLVGQGDIWILVFEYGSDDDWINYILNNGPVTDKMCETWIMNTDDTLVKAQMCLANASDENDRALAARSTHSFTNNRDFNLACIKHKWEVKEEFDGYIY